MGTGAHSAFLVMGNYRRNCWPSKVHRILSHFTISPQLSTQRVILRREYMITGMNSRLSFAMSLLCLEFSNLDTCYSQLPFYGYEGNIRQRYIDSSRLTCVAMKCYRFTLS